MINRIFRKVNLSKDDRQGFWLLFLLSFSVAASIAFYSLPVIAKFLHAFTIQELAETFLFSGLIFLLVSSVFTHFQIRVSFKLLACCIVCLCIATVYFIFTKLYFDETKELVYWAFVANIPFSMSLLLVYNGFFDRIFNIGQVKKLSGVLSFGKAAGGISAFLVVPFLHIQANVELSFFLLLSVSFLLISLCLVIYLTNKKTFLQELQDSAQFIKTTNNYLILLKKPYVVYLAVFSAVAAVAFVFFEFSFFYVIKGTYDDQEKLLSFLSVVGAFSLGGSFFLQFVLRSWIINQYGIRLALLLLPAIMMIFMIVTYVTGKFFGYSASKEAYFLFFIVWTITFVLGKSLEGGVLQPTYQQYFSPIDSVVRFDTRLKAESVTASLGLIAAGLLVRYISHYLHLELIDYNFFIFSLLAVWIVVTVLMHKQYRDVLKNTLAKHQGQVQTDKISLTFLERLYQDIPHVEAVKLPRYLNIFKVLDPVTYREIISILIQTEDDDVQRIALQQAGDLCLLEAIPTLESLQRSKYFHVSRNSDLIRSVYSKLKGAEFRLEKLKYVEQLTLSKQTNERVFGAMLTAYAEDEMKVKLLNKLFRDVNTLVRYHAVASAASFDNPELYSSLIEKLGDSRYSNAAVAAIVATGENMLPALESAFYITGQEEKVQIRIIQIYGRIGSQHAVDLLLKKLKYPNQNIVSAALNAISMSGYTVAFDQILQIKTELEETCGILVWNMTSYLDLEQNGSSELLLHAMKSEIDQNYNTIFQLMSLIYEPRSVELVRKNLYSGNPDEAEFASELLDIFVAEETKPMLLPLLNVSNYEEKVSRLQGFFPTEPRPKVDVLQDLVQRDYKWINRWTKVCALQELSDFESEKNTELFQANLVNPNPMLRETAALILFRKDADAFEKYLKRIGHRLQYINPEEIISKIKIAEAQRHNDIPSLKWEITGFLKRVAAFQKVSGLVLSEVAKYAIVNSYMDQEQVAYYESFDALNYYVVCQGNLTLKLNTVDIGTYEKCDLINPINFINYPKGVIQLWAKGETILIKIPKDRLEELLSFYDEIPASFLAEINESAQKQAVTV